MQSLGNQTIRGWYRVPIGKTNIPVVLQIPPLGGSLYDIRSLVESPKYGIPYDFAVLSLNIRGHGNSQDVIKAGNHPQQLISHGLKTKEEYIYRGAVMDCIRGIDFLHTRPELDKSKIIAEGASQGGALALLTAGLDIRVALCAPDVPFLCDIDRLVASTDWVERELRRYIGTQKNLSLWKLQQNLSYFDTKNIADKIRVPVLMSVGLQDWTCPAHTSIATYNQITSPKILKIYPHGTHEGGGGTHRKYKFEWIRKQSGL
jgi:cephalosporin-C deacetylase-like acetyl esterase